MPDDPYDLNRFVFAQHLVYTQVRDELARGRKASHWMWFVFPQIAGLGFSERSQRYAISGLDEARAYLTHPILGARSANASGWFSPSRGAPPMNLRQPRRQQAAFEPDIVCRGFGR